MAQSELRFAALVAVLGLTACGGAFAQSAGEVARCFQNPAACSGGGGGGGGAAPAPAPAPVAARPAPAADYSTVLNSAEADRKKIQESLRTLEKYNGPIDGNLQSEATMKAIGDWQKGRNTPSVGKLTPQEAAQLNAEASRAPIRRLDPTTQAAAAPPPAPTPTPMQPPQAPSNADALKALQAKLAERRKAAEPKANAAVQGLVKDLDAYVKAGGQGAAGEQFPGFAKWYADNKAAGRTVGAVTPVVDDYGDAKAGAATTAEIHFDAGQAGSQCLVFAWLEGTPRKNTQTFSCDEVAAVEKWKTDQSLKSAWR